MSAARLNRILILLSFITFCFYQVCTPVCEAQQPPQVISHLSTGEVVDNIIINNADVVMPASISAKFNVSLNQSTINETTFSLKDGGGTLVAGSITYDQSTFQVIFTPTYFLSPGVTYTVTLTTGIQNSDGTPLAADYSWSFTTDPYLGGVPSEGNLLVTPLSDGSIGVYRYISGTWQAQVFSGDHKGSRLQVNGAGYTLGYYNNGTLPTQVVNTLLNNNQTRTEWTTANGLRIIQEITYQSGAVYFGLKWKIANESTTGKTDLRFFHGEDAYFLGVDSGAGFWDAPNNTIGVQRTYTNSDNSTDLRRMSLQAIITPSDNDIQLYYDSEAYNLVGTNVNSGALTNTIDPDENTDNGYALEWRKPALAAGTTWDISAFEKFADVPIGSVSVTAPVTTACKAGASCNLTFTVTNPNNSTENVTLALASDQTNWIATTATTSISVSAVSSQQVVVQLTIPAGVPDAFIGHLTLSAKVGASIANDTAAINVQNPVIYYTLSRSVVGTGSGSISAYPEATTFVAGTTVQLTASSAVSSAFTGWSGDCSGTSTPYQLVMDSDKSCTANFTINTFTLTANADAGGSISHNGAATVNYGTGQNYTITPNTGYHIADVKVDGLSQGAVTSYNFANITASHTIDATFAINTYALTTSVSTGTGTIALSPAATQYDHGSTVHITANPALGWTFDSWGGDCTGTVNLVSLTMDAAKACSAAFSSIQYTITATANTGGAINPIGVATVNYGAGQSYTITPNTGYRIIDVKIDGLSQGAITTYSFSNVTASHTIDATFAIKTFSINITGTITNGTISCTSPVNYNTGSSCTISPATGYHLATFSIGGVDKLAQVSGNSYTISGITANQAVTGSFSINTYTISSTAGTGGSISGTATVNYGAGQTYTITPNTGYHIIDVKVDGLSQGAISTYNFTSVTTPHTIDATFASNTFTVTATAGAGGVITPNGASSVNFGAGQNITISPNTGYHIVDVKVDGISHGAIASYSFSNVTSPHTIDAFFAVNAFSITASATAGGTITPAGITFFSQGASQVYAITPNTGYVIIDVKVDNVSVGKLISYPFNNLSAGHTIEVSFAPDGILDPANTTGIPSISDALIALTFAMGDATPTAAQIRHADAAPLVNGVPVPDGKIDLGDVLLLLRRIVGLANW